MTSGSRSNFTRGLLRDYKTSRNLREPSFEALLDTALPPDSLGRVIVGALDNTTWPGCLAEIGIHKYTIH